jgi:hypothetical protein
MNITHERATLEAILRKLDAIQYHLEQLRAEQSRPRDDAPPVEQTGFLDAPTRPLNGLEVRG